MELRIADASEDWDAWEKFNLEHGNVFQSRGFAELMRKTNFEVNLLLAEENKKIVGGTVYLIPKIWGLKIGEMRTICGPIANDIHIYNSILTELQKRAELKQSLILQIKSPFPKNIEHSQLISALKQNGFHVDENAPGYSFNLDLGRGLDELKKNLDKKTRNAITKAEKEGVTIKETTDTDLVYTLYVGRTKTKANQVPIPKEFFKYMLQEIPTTKCLIAYYKDKPLAESTFFEYNNVIYYFNNGSLPEYWRYNPNTLLVWHIIKNNANSKKILNLYGVPKGEDKNHPSYGIYKFKSGFNGELLEEMVFASYIVSPKLNKIVNFFKKGFLPIYKRLIA